MLLRRLEPNGSKATQASHMYNDMRRIRTEALLPYYHEENGRVMGLTAFIVLDRLRRL